ncbi:MAG: hypothetical protein K5931_04395 [Lachnospiraceae bacterium]|nr:hypothetical protein [Lachnospiraceae bacterium]
MKKRFMIFFTALAASALMMGACSNQPGETVDNSSELSETKEDSSGEALKDEAEEKQAELPLEEDKASSDEAIEKAIEAYAAFVEERLSEDELGFNKFLLIHLDDDLIPELAIAKGGAHSEGVELYSYDGKSVNEIGVFGSNGQAYYEKDSGIIYGFYTGMGESWHKGGLFKDGKLSESLNVVIAEIYDEGADGFEPTGYKYYIPSEKEDDIKDISKEEYEEILGPYLPENRDYRLIDFENLKDLQKEADILQALKDSLDNEDKLPEADLDKYKESVLPM